MTHAKIISIQILSASGKGEQIYNQNFNASLGSLQNYFQPAVASQFFYYSIDYLFATKLGRQQAAQV